MKRRPAQILLILLVLFAGVFSLVESAEASSERRAGKEALRIHEKSMRAFAGASLSEEFLESARLENSCTKDFIENLVDGPMGDGDKLSVAFLTLAVYSIDFVSAASRDVSETTRAQARMLRRAAKQVPARSPAAKKITRSLAGHADLVSGLLQFSGQFDFCRLRDLIGKDYTSGAVLAALEEAGIEQWLQTLSSNRMIRAGNKKVRVGVRSMERVHPSLNPERIEAYTSPPSDSIVRARSSTRVNVAPLQILKKAAPFFA